MIRVPVRDEHDRERRAAERTSDRVEMLGMTHTSINQRRHATGHPKDPTKDW